MSRLIGADPELFLVDATGKFISAIGKIGGSKKQPRQVGNGISVQEDNVAVEFNITPAASQKAFTTSCQQALDYLTEYTLDRGLFLEIKTSANFPSDQLKHVKSVMSGCDPDFNAWTGKENPRPQLAASNLRVCGGHLHFGFSEEELKTLNRRLLMQHCDVCVGLASVLEDEDTERRKLYGMAGSFRPKPYGAEYRALGNYWLKSTDAMKKTYDRALLAVERAVDFEWLLTDEEGARIQKAINTYDKKEAEVLMAEYGVT